MRSKPSLARLKKILWDLFSKYIRNKYADEDGAVACFTCGRWDHWKNMDAGHYIPKSVSLALRYDERNVHPQCTACNRFRHGNLTQYALSLKKKYGADILEALDNDKHSISKYNRSELEEMIELYKNKLKEESAEFIIGAR